MTAERGRELVTAATLHAAHQRGGGRWITTTQAAQILAVNPKTLARWEAEGRLAKAGIGVGRTLGGHRRFLERDVRAAVAKRTFTEETT